MAKTIKLTQKEYSHLVARHYKTGVHTGKLNALWYILEQTEPDIAFYAIEAYMGFPKRRAQHRKWKAAKEKARQRA